MPAKGYDNATTGTLWIAAPSRPQDRFGGPRFPTDTSYRPRYIGLWTNDIVYYRLAPKVLEQLKIVNPKQEGGRRKHKFIQMANYQCRVSQASGTPRLCRDDHEVERRLARFSGQTEPATSSVQWTDSAVV